METPGTKSLIVLLLVLCYGGTRAQTAAQTPCSLQMPSLTTSAPNIFNDQQEQDLGDALAEYFESDLHIAQPGPNDELTRIGERLLAVLPPTGVHYRFRVYESGDINGFSLAGGRVYISRKLIAAAANEDELAGVLAHEIGHLATHQTAIEMTRQFRMQLGITQVGDRADIFAKVHQLFITPAKGTDENDKQEEKDEVVADRVAIYALVRAGYAPESYPAFFNRAAENRGKTGNWLTDVFGVTQEASLRYRSAMKLVKELPAGCAGKKPSSSAEFQAWQRSIVEERIKESAGTVPGDKPLQLDSPLRPGLARIRFSPDGRYLLAQDEGGITVVDRNAEKSLFRIDAPKVKAADFTPDSQSIVFQDENLRVENWNVATEKRVGVNEVVVYGGCAQTWLTRDGETMICVNLTPEEGALRVSLKFLDVETGKTFYEKPKFFEPTGYQWESLVSLAANVLGGYNIVNMAESPDSHYLMASSGSSLLAYDLKNRQPLELHGKLKGMQQTRMAFVAPDQILVMGDAKGKGLFDYKVLSFPQGEVVKEGVIGNQFFEGATRSGFMLVWPLSDYNAGLMDVIQDRFVWATKLETGDIWDKFVASEAAGGGLAVQALDAKEQETIPLPLAQLPRLSAGLFSRDGKYLAVSLKDRSEIWELQTGKKILLMRPFQSAWMDSEDRFFGEFPKFAQHKPEELEIDLSQVIAKSLAALDDQEWQYHNLELRLKPMGKGKDTGSHATFEVKNMSTQAVLWTHDYAHERPAFWGAEDNRLVLAWDLNSQSAKDEIRDRPALRREEDALTGKKRGLLIETVAPDTGAPLEQVVVPEPDLTGEWNDTRHATVSGEYVLVRGEQNNTAIFKMSSGEKVGEFFGVPVASDAQAGVVAAVNRDDEVLLVDECTGKELQRFTLGSPVRLARIVASGEDRVLLVLTADQVVHRLPLPKGISLRQF